MALTELQRPTKVAFYGRLQGAANKMNNLMHEWSELAEFVNNLTTEDLDAMGVAAGDVRTDLTEFRTIMSELHDFFTGTATTQTHVPETVVDKIRSI